MRKMLPFTFGVLVGMIAATAWAHFPTTPVTNAPAVASASMNPLEMMWNARPLPVQQYDAF